MTNDKQRDRLVELLKILNENPEITCPQYKPGNMLDACRGCQYNKEDGGCDYTARKADYLLANGVIVPPCKVGDKVYVVIKNMPFVPVGVYEGKVVWYALGEDGLRPTVEVKCDIVIINGANLGVYLEDIFPTREEAEKALKGGAE